MNTNLPRKVYVEGNPSPYEFNADPNLTDATILTVLANVDPMVNRNATLAWREQREADGHTYLVATVVTRAQTKG